MENQEQNELIKRPSAEVVERQHFDLRKRPFQRYQEKKKSKLISDLTAQIANVPQLVEQLTKNKEMVLDISKELAKKIANGELEFIRKGATGEAVGILRDPKTKEIFTQLPIKEMPLDLGASIATAGLTMKMQEISHKLDELDNKINRVNRNFDLNRYAEVQSAQDKYKLALLTKDPDVKKTLLLESLSQSTNAKNLLSNQLYETKMQLKIAQENSNKILERVKNAVNPVYEKEATLAQTALDNLDYMKDAFSFQIATLAELGEYEALNYAVSDFKDMILEDFSGNDALLLDGSLSTTTNPFKYLSENVVESTTSIIEFLDHNEEMLEMHFLPSNLSIEVKEESLDGN